MMGPLADAAAELEARLLSADMPEAEREEGRAYLGGLVRWELNRALVSSDPGRPALTLCMDDVSKWGLENPDNIYRSAAIDGDAEYVLRGERGTTADLVFEVLTGLAGDDGTVGQGISCLDLDTLAVGADGTFTVRIGPTAGPGNHLATGPGARELFIRQTLGDWDETVGVLTLERLSPPPAPPLPVQARLALAAERLTTAAGFFETFAARWRDTVPVNACTPPAAAGGGGFLPGQRNAVGQFDLAPDDALVVTVDPVPCRYMSLAIGHHRWFTSFDYRHHRCHLNGAQLRMSADGRQYLVLAATDPGVPNWIDTAGHQSGFMFLRYQGVDGAEPGTPAFTVAPVAKVRDVLPAGEPVVSPEARAVEMAARRRALDRRFRP